MKKKALCVFVSMILILNIFTFSSTAKDPDFEVFQIMSGVTDAEGNVYNDYYVDENGNVVELFENTDDFRVYASDALPTSYSSVDKGYITAPKNQGGSASCWAFSTISALETSSIMQGFDTLDSADYSETHLAWFGQNELTTDTDDGTYGDGRNVASPFLTGAHWRYATSTLARGSGLQLEKNAPWIISWTESEMNQMRLPESERYVSHLRIKGAHLLTDTSLEGIKKAIVKHGSLMAAIYVDYDIFALTRYAQYYQNTITGKTNHAITIVGWDDNYSRTNFNSSYRPENNGAWLCKNSWGTSAGINGYFWLSYEETSLTNYVYYEAMKADEFEKIYQYDGSMMKYTFSSRTAASTANTFVAKGNEILTHAGFFSVNNFADVTVRVYKGKSTSTTNPTLGTTLVSEATTTVSNVEYGYQTIELANAVELTTDEIFTVVVTFDSPETYTYIATEGQTETGVDKTVLNYKGNPGESFVCINGFWYDTSALSGKDYNNVCVKAMTASVVKNAGDVNDDGTVNLKDAIVLRRHLAGGYDVSINKHNCDVNADTEINLTDVVLIVRYLAGGYSVTLK